MQRINDQISSAGVAWICCGMNYFHDNSTPTPSICEPESEPPPAATSNLVMIYSSLMPSMIDPSCTSLKVNRPLATRDLL